MVEFAVYPFPWGFLEVGYEGSTVISLKKRIKRIDRNDRKRNRRGRH